MLKRAKQNLSITDSKNRLKNPADKNEKPRDRDVRFFAMKWSDDGSKAVVMARSADNKDRWIMKFDPATAKASVLDHLHDDAWVNNFGGDSLGWLTRYSNTIYFVSERDGYAHLYTQKFDGGNAQQLTKGKYEVSDIQIAEDKTKFYFTSSEVSPHERHFYTMNFDGSAKAKLTSAVGNNQATISPDGSMFALLYSSSNKPWKLFNFQQSRLARRNKSRLRPWMNSRMPTGLIRPL